MADWISSSDTVSAGAAILTLSFLYCMLFPRIPAARGTQRFATTSPRTFPLPYRLAHPSTPANRGTDSPPGLLARRYATMLQDALRKHNEQEASKAAAREVFSRNPTSSMPSTNAQHKQDARDPLQPVTGNVFNGSWTSTQQRSYGTTVKRTSSGLAKIAGGSFEVNTPDPTSTAASDILYDDNDFDDDLEIEELASKPSKNTVTRTTVTKTTNKTTVTYPTLPAAAPDSPSRGLAFSPTRSRQQSAQQSVADDALDTRSGRYPTDALTPRQTVPHSSGLLPWSSSPVAHFNPAHPVKRRLPWENDNAASDEQPASTAQTIKQRMMGKSAITRTPAPKQKAQPRQRTDSPWNTSASAMKQQIKQHRDEARKATFKVNEPNEAEMTKIKSSRGRPAKVFLSEEQQHVLNLVIEKKKSVFFTGSAGTGKSVLMREIITTLRRHYQREPDRIAVTASTGLAACNVGGVTLHSFAGFGLGKEDVPELVRKIKRNQKAKHRWMRTKVLVIDEVSMVDAEMFDKLEAIARQLRNNGRPFGGIQLVITGDFFQLPPVPDSGRVAKFAFDASTWNTAIQHTIGLHHVFRQKDPVFAGMLNEMREGRLSESSIAAFRKLSRNLDFEDSIVATELFPTRQEVDRANNTRLGMLQGTDALYQAVDGGSIPDKAQRDKILANCMAPENLLLKKGAQVMLIKNIDELLVNGSLGQIVGFMSEVRFDSYVREDRQDGEEGSETTDIGAALEAKALQRSAQGFSTAKEFPVVRFRLADGNSRDMLCQPETWKVELPNGEVQASRTQIPLILAWALSIHKAQGQTLDRVKVDLGKVFEKGQAYVALSRATSMKGLQVMRFDPKKVLAHDRVRTFYSNLSRVELEEKS